MKNYQGNSLGRLRQMCAAYRKLPYDVKRVALTLEALELAEKLDNAYYRLRIRYDLIWAYEAGDDPAKALPVCAEFFTLLEKYPNCLPQDEEYIEVICVAMIAHFVALSLPQIPLKQCRALLEQFHDQVKKYGYGERLWQIHACFFYQNAGDLEKVEEHLKAFWVIPRDELSDCEGCEAENAADMLLGLGRRKEAWTLVKPFLDGTVTDSYGCKNHQWRSLALFIWDALDYGELQKAKRLGKRMARYQFKSRGDLNFAGTMLRLKAYTELEQSVSFLEKAINWSIGMWDKSVLFQFYLGAGVFCVKLKEQTDTVSMNLSKTFALYSESRVYNCAVLAEWFYNEAKKISQLFDNRNNSDYYGKKLEQTFHSLQENITERIEFE